MTLLKIQNISHHYGHTQVLKDINIELRQGEMLGILGASGSGKTTLLRSVAGFVNPQQGTITIGSQAVLENGHASVHVEDRNIGMVFQDHALFPHMTVSENILFGIHEHPDRHERCDSLLKLVDMAAYAQRYPGTLSGGQQQRIALVRALAPKPTLLLLDEPFANLDANLRHQMAQEVREILKSTHTTAMMVTHDKNDALTMADQLAILQTPQTTVASSLVQFDTPSNLYNHPVNQVAAQLTGTCTCIHARANEKSAQSELGTVPLQNTIEGECLVVLRPENLEFKPSRDGPCMLTHRNFFGGLIQWTLKTPCGDVILHTSPHDNFDIGQSGHLSYLKPCWAFKS